MYADQQQQKAAAGSSSGGMARGTVAPAPAAAQQQQQAAAGGSLAKLAKDVFAGTCGACWATQRGGGWGGNRGASARRAVHSARAPAQARARAAAPLPTIRGRRPRRGEEQSRAQAGNARALPACSPKRAAHTVAIYVLCAQLSTGQPFFSDAYQTQPPLPTTHTTITHTTTTTTTTTTTQHHDANAHRRHLGHARRPPL